MKAWGASTLRFEQTVAVRGLQKYCWKCENMEFWALGERGTSSRPSGSNKLRCCSCAMVFFFIPFSFLVIYLFYYILFFHFFLFHFSIFLHLVSFALASTGDNFTICIRNARLLQFLYVRQSCRIYLQRYTYTFFFIFFPATCFNTHFGRDAQRCADSLLAFAPSLCRCISTSEFYSSA